MDGAASPRYDRPMTDAPDPQEDELQGLRDDLAAKVDYMKTIANATQRLTDAVSGLLDSLPEETRAQIARQLAEETGEAPDITNP